jgi:hypothetical protein
MSPEVQQAPDPESSRMGGFARITGVFFEPEKTFADIGRQPQWFLPLALIVLSAIAFYAVYGQKVGWERFMQQQLATNARAQQQMERIPAEQRAQAMAMQAKFTGIMFYATAAIGFPIILLLAAAVLSGLCGMMSAGLKYKQIFAIVCFAGLPMILRHLLSIVVAFLKNPDDFNVQNPLAFNLGAFMDPVTANKFLYTFAVSFDLFAFWIITLEAIGLSAAAGKKRLSFGGAFFAVLASWVLLVMLPATMAAVFS